MSFSVKPENTGKPATNSQIALFRKTKARLLPARTRGEMDAQIKALLRMIGDESNLGGRRAKRAAKKRLQAKQARSACTPTVTGQPGA